jgi:hypothetical protein
VGSEAFVRLTDGELFDSVLVPSRAQSLMALPRFPG